MFDGGDRRIGGLADDRAEFGHRDFRPFGLDQPVAIARQAGAQEYDAGIRVGRMKNDTDGSVGMNACSNQAGAFTQSRLFSRLHTDPTRFVAMRRKDAPNHANPNSGVWRCGSDPAIAAHLRPAPLRRFQDRDELTLSLICNGFRIAVKGPNPAQSTPHPGLQPNHGFLTLCYKMADFEKTCIDIPASAAEPKVGSALSGAEPVENIANSVDNERSSRIAPQFDCCRRRNAGISS